MGHSRIIGFLASALCLFVCVSASANVSNDAANKAVMDTQAYVKEVYDNAYADFIFARTLLSQTKIYKQEAEQAASAAAKVAQGNSETQAIAEEAQKALVDVLQGYPEASKVIMKTYNVTKKLLEKATELKKRSESAAYIAPVDLFNYSQRKKKAEGIKAEAEQLRNEMEKSFAIIEDAFGAWNKVQKSDKSPKIAEYRVSAIIALGKIEAMLEKAESYIKETKQKIDEINATNEKMKQLEENSPSDAREYVSVLQYQVNGDFTAASGKLREAEKKRDSMIKLKTDAIAGLEKIKTQNNAENAYYEASGVMGCAKAVAKTILEIKQLLYSVTISAENTKSNKIDAMRKMGMKIDAGAVSEDRDKATATNADAPNLPVKGTTEIPSKSVKKEQAAASTGQPANDITGQAIRKDADKSITGKSDQPISGAPVGSLDKKSGDQQRATSTPQINENTLGPIVEKLQKPVHHRIKGTVIDRTELARNLLGHSAELGDSAVTVSVSLLLALIACAAMH